MGDGLVCLTDPGRQTAHIFTSMFLHGSWMHILGNMWFLWIFGNNVEDAMGRLRFVVFYLLTGVAAALAQVVLTPASAVPMVGASGAISGVMGAYIVLYPHVRVFMIVPLGFFVTSMAWPAWMMLGYWFVLQFVSGLTAIGREGGRRRLLGALRRVRGRRGPRQALRAARTTWPSTRRDSWRPRRLGFGPSARRLSRVPAAPRRPASPSRRTSATVARLTVARARR